MLDDALDPEDEDEGVEHALPPVPPTTLERALAGDPKARRVMRSRYEERLRQVAPKDTGGEALSPEHDDAHSKGELALSAAAYAVLSVDPESSVLAFLASQGPCAIKDDQPLHALVKAGALILAEIERRLRAGETVDG